MSVFNYTYIFRTIIEFLQFFLCLQHNSMHQQVRICDYYFTFFFFLLGSLFLYTFIRSVYLFFVFIFTFVTFYIRFFFFKTVINAVINRTRDQKLKIIYSTAPKIHFIIFIFDTINLNLTIIVIVFNNVSVFRR